MRSLRLDTSLPESCTTGAARRRLGAVLPRATGGHSACSLAVCAGIALLVLGCEEPQLERRVLPRPVDTIRVGPARSTIQRSFAGIVRATEGVELGFEIGGRIVELRAEDGVRFEKGAPLARVDSTGYQATLNNAHAGFAAADGDFQRTQRLYENANASRSQLDGAMAVRETARANLDIALKQMADTTLRMPYAGVVGRVHIDTQQVVAAGQTVLSIRGESGLEMEIGVPARLIDNVKVGSRATISLGALHGFVQAAHISEVSPQISANTTYLVTVAFNNPKPQVLEGMDGEASLALPNPAGKVVTVPLACVASGGRESTYVWVVAQERASDTGKAAGRLSRRYVDTGQLRENSSIEILRGLQPGELVVSRGVHSVEEGQRVFLDLEGAD